MIRKKRKIQSKEILFSDGKRTARSVSEAISWLREETSWSSKEVKMMHIILDKEGHHIGGKILLNDLTGRKLPNSVFKRIRNSGALWDIRNESMKPRVMSKKKGPIGVVAPSGFIQPFNIPKKA